MADGVANRLLGYCLLLMSGVPTEQQIETAYRYSFDNESGRLKLWAHGFDAINGYLDEVLKHSKYLREPTILLLTDLASCLVGVFKGAKNEYSRSLLEKAIQDAIHVYPHKYNTCYDSDSEGGQGSIVEELHDIIDSLYQLAPALNDVLEELQVPENLKLPPITEFYRKFILNKLPDARSYLILRLAEGNTRCHEQLRSLAERVVVPTDSIIDSNIRATGQGNVQGNIKHIAQNIRITVNDVPLIELSHAQPSLYDSGVGTSYGSFLQPPQPPSTSGSGFSALSSCSAAKDRPSLPPIPESSGPKAGFSCPFCARPQSQIDNSRKWRKHIYSDIKPYMCTYENCTEGQKSFGSTRQWMSHLNWHKLSGALHRHSDASHKFPDDSGSDVDSCPLCFKEFVSSPAKLYRHISHHMEDIRIFALPPSYRQLEDGYSGDDNSSNTEALVEGSRGSGLSVIVEEYPPGTAPNTLKRKLKSQGMFDKKELVGDWVSVSSFRSEEHDEDISPNFEDSGEALGSDHSTNFLKQTSRLSDKRMKTDGNDQVPIMDPEYDCPYYRFSSCKEDHPCKSVKRKSLKTLYRHVARIHLKALACPQCTMRFGGPFERRCHMEKGSCKGPGSHNQEAPPRKVVDLDIRARACKSVEALCGVLMPNGQVEYDYMKAPNSTDLDQAGNTEEEYSDKDPTPTVCSYAPTISSDVPTSNAQAQEWADWVLSSRPLTDEELIEPAPKAFTPDELFTSLSIFDNTPAFGDEVNK